MPVASRGVDGVDVINSVRGVGVQGFASEAKIVSSMAVSEVMTIKPSSSSSWMRAAVVVVAG